MNDKHFYLTLPSNSSKKYYGSQKPNDYKTKLDHAISLDPELWEVGLAQISYPKSYPNLPKTMFYVGYPSHAHKPGPFHTGEPAHSVFTTRDFGGTRFLTPRHLIRDLQKDIRDILPEDMAQGIKVKYDDIANRMKIHLQKDFSLWLHDPLGTMLGLSSKVATRVPLSAEVNKKGFLLPNMDDYSPLDDVDYAVTAPYTVNVDRLIPTINVYCDLVQQQIVGDAYVQMLRALTVPDSTGDMVTHKFTNVHYVNLQTGNFEAVRIMMVDCYGKKVDFQHGDVITKLHFKRKTS